jgi:dihydrofolate synthase/folylpolyglutamate synthase
MNYHDTLQWMFSQLPMYQREGKSAFKKDLSNSLALSKKLNFPEKQFKTVHVAGTNGKGSTSHMIASILQESGYKVGLYTSPHLKDFRERIKINGQVIEKKEVINFIESNRSFFLEHQLSFFEMTVGLAFDYFAKQEVDIAIVEVGLGGRLDSTNIIVPEVSVITNISLDHTQMLGETTAEIAFEKAGIIKKRIPVVLGEFQQDIFPVIEKRAQESEAEIIIAERNIKNPFKTDLLGNYQIRNSKTALQTIDILRSKGFRVSDENCASGLIKVVKNTGLLGRWQELNKIPKVICDTAHNSEGLKIVLEQLIQEPFDNLHIILGFVEEKNLEDILPLFPKEAVYYFCKPDILRGLDAWKLQLQCFDFGLMGDVYDSVKIAYKSAMESAKDKDFIFIGGSTFVVAEVL